MFGTFAVLAAAGGTALGIKALSDKSAFDSNPTTAAADTAQRDALLADMCFGLALTLGVTTLVLFIKDSSGESKGSHAAQRSDWLLHF